MSESVPDMSKRNHALDASRGIALMLVMWYHAGAMPAAERAWVGPLAYVHDAVLRVGWVGMDCFFVMSGFLVGGLLFSAYKKHGRLDVGRFYLRRGFKIWPTFYVLWVFTLVFGEAIGRPVTAARVAAEGLLVQNFIPGMWVHTWSLGLEEQFYILLPLILLGAMRLSRGRGDAFAVMPAVYAVVLAGVLAARVVTVARLPGWGLYTHYTPTHLRFDELMLGVLCAYWYHFRRESLRRWVATRRWVFWVVGAAGLSVPVWSGLQSTFVVVAGYTLTAVGFAAVMMLMVEPTGGRAEAGRPSWWVRGCAFVGIHSYSIYVFHQPVRWTGGAVIRWAAGREATWWEYAALVFPVAIVVGIVLARMIEMPLLVWRDRVAPSRSGGILGSGEPLSSHRPTARD